MLRRPRAGCPSAGLPRAHAEKAEPQTPKALELSSLALRLQRCAPQTPSAPRLDKPDPQTFQLTFSSPGKVQCRRRRPRGKWPRRTHLGYKERTGAGGGNPVGLARPETRSERPALCGCTSSGRCVCCCVVGQEFCFCFSSQVNQGVLLRARLAPLGAKSHQILLAG